MGQPRFWSNKMDVVYRDLVHRPISDHSETDFSENILMGVPFQVVRERVIAKGRTDFRRGFAYSEAIILSPEQKVQLYCFANFKKHFYACAEMFSTFRDGLAQWFSGHSPYLVDVGCGPATAALAMCDSIPGLKWNYVGIDAAPAMLTMAKRMLSAAQACGLMPPASEHYYQTSWNDQLLALIPPSSPVLVACSYFFASATIDSRLLIDLAHWMKSLIQVPQRSVVLLAYLNSTNKLSNTNYEYFKTLIGHDPLAHQPISGTVTYRKNSSSTTFGSDSFLHELLLLKGT